MIFKSNLIDAINSLSHDLLDLSIRVSEVERKLEKNIAKRTSGRPKKICDKKSSNAKKQPRTKDGKFAKKN